MKRYHSLVDGGMDSLEAAQKVYDSYSNIRVLPVKKWKPTNGNPGSRRGPVPHGMKQKKKTGPKPKLSRATRQALVQTIERHPEMTNHALASHLCQRDSQAEESDPQKINKKEKEI